MTQTLARLPRRPAPDTRPVCLTSNTGLPFVYRYSLPHSQSPPTVSHSSSSSLRPLCIVFLLAVSLSQTPSVTTAKAVIKSEDNAVKETVVISPPYTKDVVSTDNVGDGEPNDPLLHQDLVDDFRTKMSKHHDLEHSTSLSFKNENLLNGTHPEGKKVRQRLRDLVRRRSLMVAGDATLGVSSLGDILLPVHEDQVDEYVFYSSEGDLHLPVKVSHSGISETEPLSVLTFNTLFRLPQEVYHDLIIKTAILRMRISQSEANLYRKLISLGMRITANIYLLERNRQSGLLETNPRDYNDTFWVQTKLLKSTTLRPDSDNLVIMEIDNSFLEGLTDSEKGAVTIGLKVRAEKPQLNSGKVFTKFASKKRKSKLVSSNRELEKNVSMFISTPSSFLSLLKKMSTSSPNSSNMSLSQRPSDLTYTLKFPASVLVSEASLQINVITVDLRHRMEAKSRTRRSGYRRRGRSRSRGRNRGCRGGYCCPRTANVNISGAFTWNNERHFILLGPCRVNYCRGRCRAGYNINSNLGQFLSQLHRQYPRNIPGPSCTPDELGPLEVYVLDSDGYPEPREFPNMLVQSCKCL